MDKTHSFIGLFPAGGQAKRLGDVGCSKEIVPVPDGDGTMQAVGSFLLRAYQKADIKEVYLIIRAGKWDIVSTFADGGQFDLSIAYLPLKKFWGTPFTLDQAWPFIKNHNVALGFPDIIMEPDTVFCDLKRALLSSTADIVLGLYRTDKPANSDMVEFAEDGRVIKLHIKPAVSALPYTWVTAVWRPSFTRFMHQRLQEEEAFFLKDKTRPEPYVGTLINSAINKGLSVTSLIIENGLMLDIGTPEQLQKARSGKLFAAQTKE